jgi:hypothetical protein
MTLDQQFWLNWWVQLLIGLSTLAAVLVALFGSWIRYKVYPPKLRIRLLSRDGEEADTQFQMPIDTGGGAIIYNGNVPPIPAKSRWYHIHVSNDRRWAEATDVQVLLKRLEELDAAGQFKVKWAGDIPLSWRNMHNLNAGVTKVIGYPEDADLVALFSNGAKTTEPFLQLRPLIAPSPLEKLVTRDKKCQFRVVVWYRSA